MPLDPKMLNCVVRITSVGDVRGTGSIVGVPSEAIPGKRWFYLVTADHVIRNQIEIAAEVPDPLDLGEWFPPVAVQGWRQPLPDVDLAVAPFQRDRVPRFQAFRLDTDFVPEGEYVALGGTIFYLGIFAHLNVSMGRAANLGALDVSIPHESYSYRAHLVDCRSYKGFSGSPCVATLSYAMLDDIPAELGPDVAPRRADGTVPTLGKIASVASFCGMFTRHFSDEASAEGAISRYGVGVMLPSDRIREALMTDEAREERAAADRAHLAALAAARPPLV